ncbi:MAG: SMP-30/gluconolactonase/LRE family protein [Actinomycetota bacterium]|nr:SMP-30/gluconolactonase/LRE family protein [Actinomycetota bacterium]MEC9058650.1 SMP-30/gluconolactonase/LRE family protein [Actinomycetota bacterium]MEC9473671.1 SMP-30/gluconolactonase/LRE family protein [Actinomycetota bacterium]MED5360952.1 SMP-30/gluconolactonase/LRE family protein [Actinomycetota bacterium]
MSDYEILATGLEFPEGPVYMPDGSIVLVEVKRGTISRIDPTDGSVEVVAQPGGGPNGAAVGPDGALYVCNNGGFEWGEARGLTIPGLVSDDYSSGRIERIDLETGEVEWLYAEVGGVPLKGPNDLMFDSTGGFWFTDHGKTRERTKDRGGLYYGRADGSSVVEVAFPLDGPNGVGLSPQEDRVYVAETHQGSILYWELAGPGELAGSPHGRFLARPAGRKLFDSLAMDAEGNVSVATIQTGGISTFTPDGEELEFFEVDDPLCTNICFGGEDMKTAFITLSGTGKLIRTEWQRSGLVLPY